MKMTCHEKKSMNMIVGMVLFLAVTGANADAVTDAVEMNTWDNCGAPLRPGLVCRVDPLNLNSEKSCAVDPDYLSNTGVQRLHKDAAPPKPNVSRTESGDVKISFAPEAAMANVTLGYKLAIQMWVTSYSSPLLWLCRYMKVNTTGATENDFNGTEFYVTIDQHQFKERATYLMYIERTPGRIRSRYTAYTHRDVSKRNFWQQFINSTEFEMTQGVSSVVVSLRDPWQIPLLSMDNVTLQICLGKKVGNGLSYTNDVFGNPVQCIAGVNKDMLTPESGRMTFPFKNLIPGEYGLTFIKNDQSAQRLTRSNPFPTQVNGWSGVNNSMFDMIEIEQEMETRGVSVTVLLPPDIYLLQSKYYVAVTDSCSRLVLSIHRVFTADKHVWRNITFNLGENFRDLGTVLPTDEYSITIQPLGLPGLCGLDQIGYCRYGTRCEECHKWKKLFTIEPWTSQTFTKSCT